MTNNEDLMKNFSDALNAEIKNIDETMIPLLREYLNNVRSIRMEVTREVREILREARNLDEITKQTDEIIRFGKSIEQVRAVVTPEFIETLRKIIK